MGQNELVIRSMYLFRVLLDEKEKRGQGYHGYMTLSEVYECLYMTLYNRRLYVYAFEGKQPVWTPEQRKHCNELFGNLLKNHFFEFSASGKALRLGRNAA